MAGAMGTSRTRARCSTSRTAAPGDLAGPGRGAGGAGAPETQESRRQLTAHQQLPHRRALPAMPSAGAPIKPLTGIISSWSIARPRTSIQGGPAAWWRATRACRQCGPGSASPSHSRAPPMPNLARSASRSHGHRQGVNACMRAQRCYRAKSTVTRGRAQPSPPRQLCGVPAPHRRAAGARLLGLGTGARLHAEALARPGQLAGRVDDGLAHCLLVEHRQLHRHPRVRRGEMHRIGQLARGVRMLRPPARYPALRANLQVRQHLARWGPRQF